MILILSRVFVMCSQTLDDHSFAHHELNIMFPFFLCGQASLLPTTSLVLLPTLRMDTSPKVQRLCECLRDTIISAVRNRCTKVVEKAVEKTKKFEEKYGFILPTPGDLLDFCHLDETRVV